MPRRYTIFCNLFSSNLINQKSSSGFLWWILNKCRFNSPLDLKLETQSVQLNLFMSVWVKTCRSMLPLWSIILGQMGQPHVLWANFTGQIWNNKKKISQWVKISTKKLSAIFWPDVHNEPQIFFGPILQKKNLESGTTTVNQKSSENFFQKS